MIFRAFKSLIFTFFLIVISCSSDNDAGTNQDIVKNKQFKIEDFTPREAIEGDTITMTFSGLEEVITAIEVTLGNVPAEIVNFNNTNLQFVVPSQAESAPLTLTINQLQASTSSSLILTESFEVNSISPELAKIGYKTTLLGEGFTSNLDDISITTLDASGNRLPCTVVFTSDDKIEFVMPPETSQGKNTLDVLIEKQSKEIEVNIDFTRHKQIYFFQESRIQFFTSTTPNQLNVRNRSSFNSRYYMEDAQSIGYNTVTNEFFGFHYDVKPSSVNIIYYTYDNSWQTTNRCFTEPKFSYCTEVTSAIQNPNNQKVFAFQQINELNNTDVVITEIGNRGEPLQEHIVKDTELEFSPEFIYHDDLNSYISIRETHKAITLHIIDADTYDLNIVTLNEIGENSSSQISSTEVLYYDKASKRLFFMKKDDLYEIDLDTKTIAAIGSDWSSFHGNNLDFPLNFIYYQPTNDAYVELSIPNEGRRVFAINLATKQTRPLQLKGRSYGHGGFVRHWFIRD